MHDAGVGLLLLAAGGDVDEVHDRAALAVNPCAGKIEIRPLAALESEHVLIELHGFLQLARANVEVVEYADAHNAPRFSF